MVGVLVGDVNVEQTKRLLQKYFGSIPATPPPTAEASYSNKGGGVKKLRFNAEPSTIIAYHKPTLPNPDEFVFDVIETLLCDGPTSRLEKRLVYDEKVASEISCTDSYPGSRLPNLMLIWAEPNRPHSAKELASKVEEELVRLQKEPISDEELSRVRTKVKASIIYSLEKNLGLAMSLAEFEAIYGDWRLIARYPGLVEKVTADDVMRVARQYFTKENMTEILRLKK
jgi:predicted Zn-dependent peptidase